MSGAGAYLYPWDAVGDPACAERIAGLGVDRVVLAAAYHTVRALSPAHPARKVVTADHSAVYYRPDGDTWRGQAVRPIEAPWAPGSFPEAARALRGAGLKVYGWAVLAHNQRLGTLHPELAVTNAYGDRYPWALCIAADPVRDYCATLAAEIAARPDVDGLELESCGWYGYDHLHAHDKTGGVSLDPAARTLLSVCFCAACHSRYASAGLDAVRLRGLIRSALDRVFAGEPCRPPDVDAAHAVRKDVADRLRAHVLGAVRAARPNLPVLIHTHPDPTRVGANPGADPAALSALAAGAVLSCWGPAREAAETVTRVARASPAGTGVAASLLAVAGMGGRTAALAQDAAAMRRAGANELRFYHAGLAGPADLGAVRDAVTAWHSAPSDRPRTSPL